MRVYFAHGKESGPWGDKIMALAEVAKAKGFEVESPDYSDLLEPDERVKRLLNLFTPSKVTVLVGSSMGGYVSTVASAVIKPKGLFLMAPAFYMRGYEVNDPQPHAEHVVVCHGIHDDIVPIEHSRVFCRKHKAQLHVLDSDHRLNDKIGFLVELFGHFLDEVGQTPRVGIFFKVGESLLTDAVPLDEAEQYGDAIQQGGHCEYHEALVPRNQPEYTFKDHAYDRFPRGRVVYFPSKKQYVIYSDRCLRPEDLQEVVAQFRLESETVVIMSDEHYQCAGCNKYFLD